MVLKKDPRIQIRFIPREPGVFTAAQVKKLAEIVSREGAGPLRLVLDLPLAVAVSPALADDARRELASVGLLLVPEGPCIKEIKVCPLCDHGTGSYRSLGQRLNEELLGKEAPGPIRISVSGCGCSCAMAPLQDIGLVAAPGGYTLYVGGNPYGKPVLGEKVAENLSDDQVLAAIQVILELFEEKRGHLKYLHQMVRKDGSEPFRDALKKLNTASL